MKCGHLSEFKSLLFVYSVDGHFYGPRTAECETLCSYQRFS